MPTIDKYMDFEFDDCPRCGMNKAYHDKSRGEHCLPCIRKKPYKLKDGKDVVLGMQVWHWHPWSKDDKIITGMVRFISSWGNITLWKYPEDRVPKSLTMPDGRVIEFLGDLAHEGSYSANFSCFSSLENVLAFQKKTKEERIETEIRRRKWDEKHNKAKQVLA